jgi:putative tricarboxylic transport membrane protein
MDGVAAPEAANNSAASGSFIPLLTLGIPSNVVTAMLLAALMIHGVVPGPMLIKERPDIFWGVVTSMYVGNLILLLLNLPLIGLFTSLLKTPYPVLAPIILAACLIGAYSTNSNTGDVLIMIVSGGFGYLLKKVDFDVAPLVLALVLGPPVEMALRQSLMISRGNPLVFFQRPIALFFILMLLVAVFGPMLARKLSKGTLRSHAPR